VPFRIASDTPPPDSMELYAHDSDDNDALVGLVTSVLFMLLVPIGLPFVFASGFDSSVPAAIVLVPAAVLAWAGIAKEGLRGLDGRPLSSSLNRWAPWLPSERCRCWSPPMVFLAQLWRPFSAIQRLQWSPCGHQPFDTPEGSLTCDPTWLVTKSLVARGVSLLPGHQRGVS
jgi:hypothetical protein